MRPARMVRHWRSVSSPSDDAATASNEAVPASGENLFRLPATSILTGTLITGLDAPTGAQAQGEPLPVLLQAQERKPSCPTASRLMVRECFALLGAPMATCRPRRAHMRGETMSCILHDGTILEQPLKAFAVGEDGKEGIARPAWCGARARSSPAPLWSAFSKPPPMPSTTIRSPLIGGGAALDVEGAQAAATSLGGATAGNALGRIADWYIEQAFQLFPVIEIDAGREIDVVLTSTFEMNLPSEDG